MGGARAALSGLGCFQMATVIHVKGDGSGTIDQRIVFKINFDREITIEFTPAK